MTLKSFEWDLVGIGTNSGATGLQRDFFQKKKVPFWKLFENLSDFEIFEILLKDIPMANMYWDCTRKTSHMFVDIGDTGTSMFDISTVDNSTICYSSFDNSTIRSSTIDNSTTDNSTIS